MWMVLNFLEEISIEKKKSSIQIQVRGLSLDLFC